MYYFRREFNLENISDGLDYALLQSNHIFTGGLAAGVDNDEGL